MRILSADTAPKQLPDSRTFRDAAGCFATGVCVVTSGPAEDFHATTVNAFTSLSLEPPLVLICLAKSSRLYPVIKANGSFVVNILSPRQLSTAQTCASKEKDLSTLEIASTDAGAPYVRESLSTLVCALEVVHEGGDHSIFVGRVHDILLGASDEALVFFRGSYGTFEALSES